MLARAFGGTGNDLGLAIAGRPNGAFAIGLYTLPASSLSFGGGNLFGHGFVASFGPDAELAWAEVAQSNDPLGVAVEALAYAPDGVLFSHATFLGQVSGMYQATASGVDGMVGRHTGEGMAVVTRQLSNVRAQAMAAIPTTDGGVAICGAFQGSLVLSDTLQAPAGASSVYLGILDESLAPRCGYAFVETELDPSVPACRLAVAGDGLIHLAANFDGRVVTDEGNEVGAAPTGFDIYSAVVSSSDGCPIQGDFIATGSDDDFATAVAVAPNGVNALAGQYRGTLSLTVPENDDAVADAFLLQRGVNGSVQWTKHLQSAGAHRITGIAYDGLEPIIVGYFQSDLTLEEGDDPLPIVTGTQAGFVAGLAPTGDVRWSVVLRGNSVVHPRGVVVANDGTVTVVGHFDGSMETPVGTISSDGAADTFVVRIAP